MFLLDIEHAYTRGRTQPLVRAGCEKIHIQFFHVEVEHSDTMGAVGKDKDPLLMGHLAQLFEGRDQAGYINRMADTDDFCPGSDTLFETGDKLIYACGRQTYGDIHDLDAVAFLFEVPWMSPPWMLHRGEDNFISLFEIQAVRDKIHPLSGVTRDRDLLWVGMDEFGHFSANFRFFPGNIRIRIIGIRGLDFEGFHQCVEYRFGHRSNGPVVHHDNPVLEEKMSPQCIPEHPIGRFILDIFCVQRCNTLINGSVEFVKRSYRECGTRQKILNKIPSGKSCDTIIFAFRYLVHKRVLPEFCSIVFLLDFRCQTKTRRPRLRL